MRRFFQLPTYHWVFVFALYGWFLAFFVYLSYNLFFLSMANLEFIRKHGFLAIMEGALFQSIEIILTGGLSLFSYLCFKACESELLSRYGIWKNRK